MAKYFQCGNRQGGCELAKTKETVSRQEWEAHLVASPSCRGFEEEVGFLAALNPKIKLLIGGLVAALVVLACVVAFASDPLKKELERLKAEVHQLEGRLDSLEANSGSKNAQPLVIEGSLKGLETKAAAAKKRIESALSAGDAAAVSTETAELTKSKKEAQLLRSNSSQAESNSRNPNLGEARDLIDSFQNAEGRVENFASRASEKDDAELASECDSLKGQIEDGIARAGSLLKKSDGGKTDIAPRLAKLDKEFAAMEARLGSFVPPKSAPFAVADADLQILATGTLAEELVLPLLLAREHGTSADIDGIIYYSTESKPGAQAMRVAVLKASDSGFAKLTSDECDLLITDGEPTAAEREAFEKAHSGSQADSHSNAQVIALDALTFSAHPDNAAHILTPLSLGQHAKRIGGSPDSPSGRAARRFGVAISNVVERRAADEVLNDKDALGISVYHQEGANIRAVRLAFQADPKALALKPSPFTVATEDYKYSFRIVAHNSPRSSPLAIDFVKFITTDRGQETVSAQGFVDLRLRPIGGDVDPAILAALAQATGLKKISGAQRLSTNFRFKSGEDSFDLKAQGDLERVPQQIAKDFSSAKVVILGFTDNTGGASINLPLSLRRAETVAASLRSSGLDAKTAGMGDQFPIDSNDNDAGKARNRRSEVWLVIP